VFGQRTSLDKAGARIVQGNESATYRCSSGATISLQRITVQDDLSLAELLHVHDGP
jgi:hypothetical protein